jgi:putative SOS response-associated peptidase YedK
MCGRYTQTRGPKWLESEFEAAAEGDNPAPRYNIAPSQEALVVYLNGERVLRPMKWGLVPSWSPDPLCQRGIINARAESLGEKPSFKSAYEKRRCLVPADGFYEWVTNGKRKSPVRFVLKDEALFAFAGIWDAHRAENGIWLHTFAIITTAANKAVLPVHDRMPVILRKEQYAAWLRPEPLSEPVARELLRSVPGECIQSYKVGPAVNHVANDSPACIQKVVEEETGWLF